jgi:glycerophosphoryl diester phosphodiesterase
MDHLAAAFSHPIAHRGLHDLSIGQIENSKIAFAAAIHHNFGIECDIQLTGDDVPVVFHDETLGRLTSQSGRVADLSADQLSKISLSGGTDCPQTFSAFLQQIDGAVPIIAELKSQGARNEALAQAVIAAASQYAGPLVFKSFDPRLLHFLAKHHCKHPFGIVVEREKPSEINELQAFAMRNLLHYPYSKFHFISCNVADLDMISIRLLRKLGLKIMTWTVDLPHERERAIHMADQIVFEGEVGKHLVDEQSE